MRIEFRSDEWEHLFTNAAFRLPRLGPDITRAYRKKVALIQAVATQQELRQFKSLHLEKLKGDRAGQHSIRLNNQWRLILEFYSDEQGQTTIIIEVSDHYA